MKTNGKFDKISFLTQQSLNELDNIFRKYSELNGELIIKELKKIAKETK